MSGPRVAVIGGGMAGLLAAHRLRQLGAEPQLFEASARVGGALRTVRRDGWLIETGPTTVMPVPPEVIPLLAAVGLPEVMVRPGPEAKRRFLVHQGAVVTVPLSVADLVATPLLSVAGRLRLLKEPFVARGDATHETVDAFARRRFGDEVAERMFDPLVAGTGGGDSRAVLARYALARLVEFERSGGSILRGSVRARSQARRRGEVLGGGIWSCVAGLEEAPRRLALALGECVHLDAPVTRVVVGEDVVITWGDGRRDRFDAAVLACPATAYRRLEVMTPGAERLDLLATMPHASLATVALGFPRAAVAHPLDGFGTLMPSAEGRDVLGVLFPSTLFAGRAPDGQVLLTAFVGGARRPDLVTCSDTELLTLVRRELGALFGARGEPSVVEITRWPEALPQAVAGHDERLAAAAAIEASGAPLAFAGAWRDGLAVGDAMLSGVRAAERLMAR